MRFHNTAKQNIIDNNPDLNILFLIVYGMIDIWGGYDAVVMKKFKPFGSSLKFMLQYVFRPRTVGAFLPSSRYLARKMVEGIDFKTARCIVEYGAGTGVFTRQILENRTPGCVVIVFEMNEAFCRGLREMFTGEANLHIINGSAAGIGAELVSYGKADYVVSGLPFASLPEEVSRNILAETRKWLRDGGMFVTFQYTLFRKGFISQYFDEIEIARVVRNLPPAWVMRCR